MLSFNLFTILANSTHWFHNLQCMSWFAALLLPLLLLLSRFIDSVDSVPQSRTLENKPWTMFMVEPNRERCKMIKNMQIKLSYIYYARSRAHIYSLSVRTIIYVCMIRCIKIVRKPASRIAILCMNEARCWPASQCVWKIFNLSFAFHSSDRALFRFRKFATLVANSCARVGRGRGKWEVSR